MVINYLPNINKYFFFLDFDNPSKNIDYYFLYT